MNNAEIIKQIEEVGTKYGKMMSCMPTNYTNGYMQAVRDCKVPFYRNEEHIVETDKVMDEITTELAEYICDMVCGNLDDVKNQEDADRICDECKLGSFICDICNEYNRINDFEKSQLMVLLKENERLRKGYQEIVERLEEEKVEAYKEWLKSSHFQDKGAYLECKRIIEIVKEVGGMND